jgi:hypothetical protein
LAAHDQADHGFAAGHCFLAPASRPEKTAIILRAARGARSRPAPLSSDDIGDQLLVDGDDLVFQCQFALLQPLYLELVERLFRGQPRDFGIEIPMLVLQCFQPGPQLFDLVHVRLRLLKGWLRWRWALRSAAD